MNGSLTLLIRFYFEGATSRAGFGRNSGRTFTVATRAASSSSIFFRSASTRFSSSTTLAIRRGEDVREKIGRMRLRVGDELLILTPKRNLERLKGQESFVILQEVDVPLLTSLPLVPVLSGHRRAVTSVGVIAPHLGGFNHTTELININITIVPGQGIVLMAAGILLG